MVKIKQSAAVEERDTLADNLKRYFGNIGINQYEYNINDYSDSLTSEIMEQFLYENGKSLFFEDNTYGYMNLPYNECGGRNVYDRPVKFRAVGLNYNKGYTIDNSVIIRNNALEMPTKTLVDYYCEQMADIEITKKIRRNAHKIPFVVYTDDETLLSAKNMASEILNNEGVIFRKKSKMSEPIDFELMNQDAEYMNDRLEDEYNSYLAKILTVLGINNYVEDKAERVQSAEVNAQEEYIIKAYEAGLEQREKACERINKMFGINLTVKRKKLELSEPIPTAKKEDDKNA